MEEISLKDRFSALKNLPVFFKLVWETSRPLTLLNIILRIIRSAIPVAILYVGKLIIDHIVHYSQGNATSHKFLWELHFLVAAP